MLDDQTPSLERGGQRTRTPETRYPSVMDSTPPDIKDLLEQLDSADRDAEALVAGLTETQAAWRAAPDSWSVAECLDHLATANRVYLRAMEAPAIRARADGKRRRGPAVPGVIGRWFARTLEPPVNPRFKGKAPRLIRPRTAPSLADAYAGFTASQREVHAFLLANSELDLAGVRFPNPFVRGVRFSLATGLHIIAAHDRRHLWQAHRVRLQAEAALALPQGG